VKKERAGAIKPGSISSSSSGGIAFDFGASQGYTNFVKGLSTDAMAFRIKDNMNGIFD
jgi:hypothetical protein